MKFFLLFFLFVFVFSQDFLQELNKLKSDIREHIKTDETSHHKQEEFLLKENLKLKKQILKLKGKMKSHFKKDNSLHSQIDKEDNKDDQELLKLKKENLNLKQTIHEILSKFQKHVSIDNKKHKDFERHVEEEEPSFITSIIRAFVTLLTGAGLGALIHSTPNFLLKLFESKIFRFLMLVLLAWQGGGGYDFIVSIVGSFIFLLFLNIFDYIN